MRDWHNLFHYHTDVFQLEFELHQQLRRPEHLIAFPYLLTELKKVLPQTVAICHAAVGNPSELLSVLRVAGFLETRYLYEPVLDPLSVQVSARNDLESDGYRCEWLPLADLSDHMALRLKTTFIEVYSAVPRLDPLTPERVLCRDWRALLQDGLAPEKSVVMLERSLPVSLAAVYHDGENGYQLGVMGVQATYLAQRELLAKFLLAQVISRLQAVDARQLRVGMILRFAMPARAFYAGP